MTLVETYIYIDWLDWIGGKDSIFNKAEEKFRPGEKRVRRSFSLPFIEWDTFAWLRGTNVVAGIRAVARRRLGWEDEVGGRGRLGCGGGPQASSTYQWELQAAHTLTHTHTPITVHTHRTQEAQLTGLDHLSFFEIGPVRRIQDVLCQNETRDTHAGIDSWIAADRTWSGNYFGSCCME